MENIFSNNLSINYNSYILSSVEEIELIKAYEAGNKIKNKEFKTLDDYKTIKLSDEAINKLISYNLGLIKSIARKFIGNSLSFDDLVQIGSLGLLKALETFDYTKGYRLSTYAYQAIYDSIRRAVMKYSHIVAIPVNQIEKLSKINKVEQNLTNTLARHVSQDEILDNIKFDNECDRFNAINLFALKKKSLSLDKAINEDDDATYSDFLSDTKTCDQYEYYNTYKRNNLLHEAINTILNNREKYVIENTYCLKGKKLTYVEMSKELDVSSERVRQICNQALDKLRNKASYLKEYIA